MSFSTDSDIERKAHQCVESVLAQYHVETLHYASGGLLRVSYEPKIGLRLSALKPSDYFRPSMTPSDSPDATLILIGDQPALLEALDECDPG